MKSPGLTWRLHPKLVIWSPGEADGILGVAVKCVDIKWNTDGEGSLLDGD